MKQILKTMARPFAWLASKVDDEDVIFMIGLASLGYGIYLFSPAWCFIVVGAVLIIAVKAGHFLQGLVTLVDSTRGRKQ